METGDVTDNIVNEPKSMEKTENNEKSKNYFVLLTACEWQNMDYLKWCKLSTFFKDKNWSFE